MQQQKGDPSTGSRQRCDIQEELGFVDPILWPCPYSKKPETSRRRDNGQAVLTRREALTAAAGLGAGFVLGRAGSAAAKEQAAQPGDAKVCVLTPEAMEGPFYFDPKLVRSDITEGKQGASLALTLEIVEAKDCAAIPGARVDVWHADALGLYSGYARQETGSAKGETFLRGTQFTGAGGEVRFTTIYPGWYPGRTPHVHFKVFVDERSVITGQLYFPDPLTDHVYATTTPYRQRKAERETLNADDFIFVKQRGTDTILNVKESGGSYLASLVIGVERNR
jgi:protocatechuate 3,4-dioxygenase beta subunit